MFTMPGVGGAKGTIPIKKFAKGWNKDANFKGDSNCQGLVWKKRVSDSYFYLIYVGLLEGVFHHQVAFEEFQKLGGTLS